ncbi:hypothetical protein LJC15_04430, partial [Desulfovibrio sp. OttesenSCG-928-G11]|nr:hypothetical protein [Desulfovibrio sp. OttesenSCG-928-G11]
MPGQGAELSLTEQQSITLIDSMPENMRDAARDFFDNKYEDVRSSHDNFILLFGDLEFLAAVGAESVGRGVGMLSADSEEILIKLLQELGVEQPEFFLEAPPEGPSWSDLVSYWGDANPNLLVPTASMFGPDFKNVRYDIRGFGGDDTIVSFNGADTIYGGQGSEDRIYKISDEIKDGNLIVGGDQTLNGITSLDDDFIILRSLGSSTDDEQGWTSQSDANYGITLMSGGSVVGSAVELSGCTGGNNVISLYGTMTGGAIYGKAVTAVNSTLGSSNISVNSIFDTDGVTLIGGILDGSGVIYGDASAMNGGQAGDDNISVDYMKDGDIYGDAATGSYTPGNNSIYVNETMSGGNIYAGDGEDIVDIKVYQGGNIYMGQGGNNQKLEIASQEADLSLKGDTGNTSIAITNVLNNSKLTVETLTGALNVTNANHDTVYVTTFAGKDPDTSYQLNCNSNTLLDVATWQSGSAYVDGSNIHITNAQNGTLYLINGALGTIDQVSGNFKIFGNPTDNVKVTVDNISGSLSADTITSTANFEITVTDSLSGTLGTGAGDDIITIATANGGTINTGAGEDKIYVTNSGGSYTLDGLAGLVDIFGSGMNVTLTNSAGGQLVLENLTGSNTITVGDSTGATMAINEMSSDLSLAGGGGTLTIQAFDGGSLDYSGITGASTITVDANTVSLVDISGVGGSTGAIININTNSLAGTIKGSDGADVINLNRFNGTGGITMTGTTINGGGGADIISSSVGIEDCTINLGDPGSDKNQVTITGTMMGDTSINGSDGVDEITVTSMTASSEISAGGGADVINVGTMNSLSIINTGSGADVINVGSMDGGAIINLGSGGNKLTVTSMNGMSGTPRINMEDPGSTELWNEVTITGTFGNGELNGSSGRDSITIGESKTGGTIDCGAGDDVLILNGRWSSGDTIKLGAGADQVKLKSIGSGSSGIYAAHLDLGADSDKDIVDLSALTEIAAGYALNIYNLGVQDEVLGVTAADKLTGGVYQITVGSNQLTINCFQGSDNSTPTDISFP